MKRRLRITGAFAVALTLVMLAGCGSTPSVQTPEGFAAFSDDAEPTALSPEGVGFRVRTVKNDPEQSLEFWSQALERHFTDAGYLPYGNEAFASPAGEGTAFEWIAPVGDQDWIYLTGIVVAGDSIVIAEAAGPVEIYRDRRAAVLDALKTITVGRSTGGAE